MITFEEMIFNILKKKKKLTQGEWAEELGVSPQNFSHYIKQVRDKFGHAMERIKYQRKYIYKLKEGC